jgi:putative zinc finger/helix-turn-helix YgiT family protein
MAKVRPFPWKCPACHNKTVQDAVLDYSTDIDHDGKTYTVHVPNLRTPSCIHCGNIVLTDDANQVISKAFRYEASLLTPDQIKSHRDELGMTQKELAAYLGVAESTLSRWETGAQIQQKMSDNLLRLFFSVPESREYLGVPGSAERTLAANAEAEAAEEPARATATATYTVARSSRSAAAGG